METKKIFKATAAIIKHAKERDLGLEDVALNFAVYFESRNSRFDRERFLKACGFPGIE
jgi:hypothetical protein